MVRKLTLLIFLIICFAAPVSGEIYKNNIDAGTIFYQNKNESVSIYYSACPCDPEIHDKIEAIIKYIHFILVPESPFEGTWLIGYDGFRLYKKYRDAEILHTEEGFIVVHIFNNSGYITSKYYYAHDDDRAIAIDILLKLLSDNI